MSDTNVTVNEDANTVTITVDKPEGPPGVAGVVAAESPATYNPATRTVGVDLVALRAELGLDAAPDTPVITLDDIGAAVAAEAAARAAADTTNANALAGETTARTNADNGEATARTNAINAEAAARIAGDNATLDAANDYTDTAVANEATARTAAIAQAKADLVNGAPGTLDTLRELADQLANDETAAAALTTSLANETTARTNADNAETAARIAGDNAEATARTNAINAEATARTDADNAINAALAGKASKAGDTITGLLELLAGARITGGDPTPVNGYRGMVVIKPPVGDNEVEGVLFKVPGPAWGSGQDYAEGNVFAILSDSDAAVTSVVPSPILKAITATTNATPVAITAAAHGFATGDIVRITGTGIAALDNKWWKITKTGTDTFTLDTSTAPGSAAATGWAFSDRSPIMHRLADTGPGFGGSIHVAPGLRGRSGMASNAPYGIQIQPTDGSTIGLQVFNASADRWPTAPTGDYVQVIDKFAGALAYRFQINAAGQTLHDSGSLAAPGIGFVGDPDTGITHLAADTFNFVAGGANVAAITATALALGSGMNITFSGTTGTKLGTVNTQKLAFWGATPIARPGAITGSRGGNAALAALLTALANIGLIVDSTTA